MFHKTSRTLGHQLDTFFLSQAYDVPYKNNADFELIGSLEQTSGKFTAMPVILTSTGYIQCAKHSFQFPSILQHFPQPAFMCLQRRNFFFLFIDEVFLVNSTKILSI